MPTDNSSSIPSVGLLVSSDLFFTSKVTGTAQALGLRVDNVDDLAAAVTRLQAGGIACVFVDLAAAYASVGAIIAALPPDSRMPVIAFGSHVATDILESARAAGAEVMPRSQFSATLPDILKRHLQRSPRPLGEG
jgi:hypothetical protein